MITLDACLEPIHVSTKVVTASTVPVVDSTEFYTHARLDAYDLDTTVLASILTAQEVVERRTNRVTTTATYDIGFDRVPGGRALVLPLAPLQSVTSITSYDIDGASTVMSTSDYAVDTNSEPPRVYLKNGKSWPTGLRPFNALIVRGVFGYGNDAAATPQILRQFVRMLATHYLEQPSGSLESPGQALALVPEGLESLMASMRLAAL